MLAVRQFTVLGVIDAAFWLYRQHFGILFVISLVVSLPATVINLAFTVATDDFFSKLEQSQGAVEAGDVQALEQLFAGFASLGGILAVSALFLMMASVFGTASTTRVASLAALERVPDLRDAMLTGVRSFWPLLSASVIATLAASFASFFLFVPGVIVFVGFALIAPIVVLEHASAGRALERSWQLTRGRRGKIFLVLLLLVIILLVLYAGLTGVVALIAEVDGQLIVQIIETLLGQATSVLVMPLWYIVGVLLYYDARVDREAFDVEMLARSVEAG